MAITLLVVLTVSAAAGYFVGVTNQRLSTPSNIVTVDGVDICWGSPKSQNCGYVPENYTLGLGQGFNYTYGYDAERINYTIISVYSATPEFIITGIFWASSQPARYILPQSVSVGTNFPFYISVVATTNQAYDGPVTIYVVTSPICCFFNGTYD